jgi:sporulation protein YlmC with PRC-barrel domain
MKTSLLCGAALAILGLAAAPLNAQTQTTTSSSSSGYVQTSKIIGTKVKTAQGEEVGVVKDVVLDRSNGCMAYTVLSAGGTGTRVAGQAKLVAVPWSVYSVSPAVSFLTVSVERDRIYNGPVFEYSRISDTAYTTNVFSHFGVSAGVGVSGSMSTTTGRPRQPAQPRKLKRALTRHQAHLLG